MKPSRHKVTFEDDVDADCVALASLGLSTRAISSSTGLSEGQVTYRLGKAKSLERKQRSDRQQWRDGTSPILEDVKTDLVAVLRRDIQRRLPVKINHPTPKFVLV